MYTASHRSKRITHNNTKLQQQSQPTHQDAHAHAHTHSSTHPRLYPELHTHHQANRLNQCMLNSPHLHTNTQHTNMQTRKHKHTSISTRTQTLTHIYRQVNAHERAVCDINVFLRSVLLISKTRRHTYDKMIAMQCNRSTESVAVVTVIRLIFPMYVDSERQIHMKLAN